MNTPRGEITAELIYLRCQVWHQARMAGPNVNPIPAHMARIIASWWQGISEDGEMDAFATYAMHGIVDSRFRDTYETLIIPSNIPHEDRIALAAMWHAINTARTRHENE